MNKEKMFAVKIDFKSLYRLRALALFVAGSTFVTFLLCYLITTKVSFFDTTNYLPLENIRFFLGIAQWLCAGFALGAALRMTVGMLLDMRIFSDDRQSAIPQLLVPMKSDKGKIADNQNVQEMKITKTLAAAISTKYGCIMLEKTGPYVNSCLLATIVFNLWKINGGMNAFWLSLVMFSLIYLRCQLYRKYKMTVSFNSNPTIADTLNNFLRDNTQN